MQKRFEYKGKEVDIKITSKKAKHIGSVREYKVILTGVNNNFKRTYLDFEGELRDNDYKCIDRVFINWVDSLNTVSNQDQLATDNGYTL